jgi:putative transposase
MRKSRFTEEQIAHALKQSELGTKVEEICRKTGISDATLIPKSASGDRNIVDWVCRSCANWRKRTASSSAW